MQQTPDPADVDRRTQIADAAIELIASRGIKSVTHRAIDTEVKLPAGSTSYYFRTRQAMLDAVADRIVTRSRADFADLQATATESFDIDAIARDVARALDDTLTRRRSQLVARYALSIELPPDTALQRALAMSIFSHPKATELFRRLGADDPDSAAADFVSLCEGLIFDRLVGARAFDGIVAGSDVSVARLARAVRTYLRGAVQ